MPRHHNSCYRLTIYGFFTFLAHTDSGLVYVLFFCMSTLRNVKHSWMAYTALCAGIVALETPQAFGYPHYGYPPPPSTYDEQENQSNQPDDLNAYRDENWDSNNRHEGQTGPTPRREDNRLYNSNFANDNDSYRRPNKNYPQRQNGNRKTNYGQYQDNDSPNHQNNNSDDPVVNNTKAQYANLVNQFKSLFQPSVAQQEPDLSSGAAQQDPDLSMDYTPTGWTPAVWNLFKQTNPEGARNTIALFKQWGQWPTTNQQSQQNMGSIAGQNGMQNPAQSENPWGNTQNLWQNGTQNPAQSGNPWGNTPNLGQRGGKFQQSSGNQPAQIPTQQPRYNTADGTIPYDALLPEDRQVYTDLVHFIQGGKASPEEVQNYVAQAPMREDLYRVVNGERQNLLHQAAHFGSGTLFGFLEKKLQNINGLTMRDAQNHSAIDVLFFCKRFETLNTWLTPKKTKTLAPEVLVAILNPLLNALTAQNTANRMETVQIVHGKIAELLADPYGEEIREGGEDSILEKLTKALSKPLLAQLATLHPPAAPSLIALAIQHGKLNIAQRFCAELVAAPAAAHAYEILSAIQKQADALIDIEQTRALPNDLFQILLRTLPAVAGAKAPAENAASAAVVNPLLLIVNCCSDEQFQKAFAILSKNRAMLAALALQPAEGDLNTFEHTVLMVQSQTKVAALLPFVYPTTTLPWGRLLRELVRSGSTESRAVLELILSSIQPADAAQAIFEVDPVLHKSALQLAYDAPSRHMRALLSPFVLPAGIWALAASNAKKAELEAALAQFQATLQENAPQDTARVAERMRLALSQTNAKGETALQTATKNWAFDNMLVLIQSGADLFQPLAHNQTVLSQLEQQLWGLLTAPTALPQAAQILSNGLDFLQSIEGNDPRTTPCAHFLQSPRIEAIDGNTPLHIAAQNGRLQEFKTLFEHGADPLAQNSAGVSAQQLLLISLAGATIADDNANPKVESTLALVERCSNTALGAAPTVTALLQMGIDSEQNTLLHQAAHALAEHNIQSLLTAGASWSTPNSKNETPAAELQGRITDAVNKNDLPALERALDLYKNLSPAPFRLGALINGNQRMNTQNLLHTAAQHPSVALFMRLVEAGGSITYVDKTSKMTPLVALLTAIEAGSVQPANEDEQELHRLVRTLEALPAATLYAALQLNEASATRTLNLMRQRANLWAPVLQKLPEIQRDANAQKRHKNAAAGSKNSQTQTNMQNDELWDPVLQQMQATTQDGTQQKELSKKQRKKAARMQQNQQDTQQ